MTGEEELMKLKGEGKRERNEEGYCEEVRGGVWMIN